MVDKCDRLRQLVEVYQEGLLTDDEFASFKQVPAAVLTARRSTPAFMRKCPQEPIAVGTHIGRRASGSEHLLAAGVRTFAPLQDGAAARNGDVCGGHGGGNVRLGAHTGASAGDKVCAQAS